MSQAADPVQPVELVIAADARQVRIARLVAGGYGSLVGMDVDALDDFRIAVDELCIWLIEHGDGSSLHLSLRVEGDAIEAHGTTAPSSSVAVEDDRNVLSRQILAVAVASHRTEQVDGTLRFWFRTHPTVSPPVDPAHR